MVKVSISSWNQKYQNILIVSVLILNCLAGSYSCQEPDSLKPPTGIEGNILYLGIWPDSIQAAALVVLKGLDEANLGDLIVAYSNPDYPGTQNSEYFFQLEPGVYFLAAVGLEMDPGIFFTQIDSVLASDNLPLVILDKTPPFQSVFRIKAGLLENADQVINF